MLGKRNTRASAIGLLMVMVELSIPVANSIFHWHTILALWALTAVLVAGIGLIVLASRWGQQP
jgi:hypothetical protein